MTNFLENKKILLIVSGGIASYKSLDLIRRLQEKKVKIDCILTESAKKFINPIIKNLQRKDINITGPYSADSLLVNQNIDKFDCFIFIYHDQALIPFKFISKFSGVNYTGNLNIIRTSPDHGTAYNLVGSNKILNKSFINSYKLINRIYNNRMMNGKT